MASDFALSFSLGVSVWHRMTQQETDSLGTQFLFHVFIILQWFEMTQDKCTEVQSIIRNGQFCKVRLPKAQTNMIWHI